MTNNNSQQKKPSPTKETASSNTIPKDTTDSQGYESFLEAGKKLQKSKKKKPVTNLTSHHTSFKVEDRLIPTISAQALMMSDIKPIETLPLLGKQGFIIRNGANLIAAYPKTGKTELVYALAKEWVKTGEIVLFITEESRQVWKSRVMRNSKEASPNIGITTAIGFNGKDIADVVRTTQATVVIVDTIRDLLGLENENDNSEVARILKPFIVTAQENKKTLIFLHHTRKEGGAHGRGITGGHAFLGIVDAFLEISPQPGSENHRLIKGAARVIKVPKLLYAMQENGDLVSLGDPDENEMENLKKRVFERLSNTWQKTLELHTQLAPNTPSIRHLGEALESLASTENIERNPPFAEGSQPGVTYRWRIRSKGGEFKNE